MSVDANGNLYPSNQLGRANSDTDGGTICPHLTVRLTKPAHALLTAKAKECNTSMKAIASEAIGMLGKAPQREKELGERIEQLKFEVMKRKEVIIFQVVLACLGVGVLGFIVGLGVAI